MVMRVAAAMDKGDGAILLNHIADPRGEAGIIAIADKGHIIAFNHGWAGLRHGEFIAARFAGEFFQRGDIIG